MTTSPPSAWLPEPCAEADLVAALSATESQCQRVARTLHEEVIQVLTALKLDAAVIRKELEGRERLDRKLREMASLLEDALDCTRRAAFDLRPLILDDLGLAPALEALAAEFHRRTGIPCSLQADEETVLDPMSRVGLFRIVQEWLQYVVLAGATAASMRLVLARQEVSLRLEHDGAAEAPSRLPVPAALRARVHLLGGAVAVSRGNARQPSRIDVRIPLGSGSA